MSASIATNAPRKFYRALLSWAYASASDIYALVVISISVLVALYYQWAETFWWAGSDQLDNLAIARWLLHMPNGLDAVGRTPGMAFFLILTGVPILDTWKGLIIGFALFSIAIPICIYYTLSWISRPLAAIAALLMIGSAAPYVYSKTGFAEQLFHFLHFLSILIASRYLRRGSPRLLTAFLAVSIALCLVRPVAALYFCVFLVVAVGNACVRKWPLTPLIRTGAIYVVCMAGWAVTSHQVGDAFFSPYLTMETSAQKGFAEAYFDGPIHGFEEPRPFAIDPSRGPASQQLYSVLIAYIKKNAAQWRQDPAASFRPHDLFGDLANDSDTLAKTMLSTPIFAYYDAIRDAAHTELGYDGGERLLKTTAQEYGTWGIMGAVHYLVKNPIRLLVGGAPPAGNRNFFDLFLQTRLRYVLGRFYSLDFPPMFGVVPVLQAAGNTDLDIVREENGSASREIIEGIKLYIHSFRWGWETTNQWTAKYKDDPDGLIPEIFRSPDGWSGVYEGFLYESLVRLFGYGRADRLYNQAAWETLRAHPFAGAIIWDNLLRATIIRTFGGLNSQFNPLPYSSWGDVIYTVRPTDYTTLTPGLARELPSEIHNNAHVILFGRAYAVFHLISFVFVIAAALLLIPALTSPMWPFVTFLTLAYLYDVAVVAVYANLGAPRYYDVFDFLPVLITFIGCKEIQRFWSTRRQIAILERPRH